MPNFWVMAYQVVCTGLLYTVAHAWTQLKVFQYLPRSNSSLLPCIAGLVPRRPPETLSPNPGAEDGSLLVTSRLLEKNIRGCDARGSLETRPLYYGVSKMFRLITHQKWRHLYFRRRLSHHSSIRRRAWCGSGNEKCVKRRRTGAEWHSLYQCACYFDTAW